MTERTTPYGRLIVGSEQELFGQAVALLAGEHTRARREPFVCALAGGSTPQAWYSWCAASRTLPSALIDTAHFTVSDERHVPLTSNQSNFGNAQRELFEPLGIDLGRCHPWKTELAPSETVVAYRKDAEKFTGEHRAYNVCFLGMGEDAHIASFFPGSPLLEEDEGMLFTSLEAPEKGLRFTVTPTGLRHCGLIVVMTMGASKAPSLRRVLEGPFEPRTSPAQILKTCANRVVWLVDAAAAAELR